MLLFGLLHRLIQNGRLTLIDATGTPHQFGPDESPAVTIRLHDRRLQHRLFLNPDLYLGEAYMHGTLTIEQGSLYELLHLCTVNHDALSRHPVQRLRRRLDRIWKAVQQHNPQHRARANVAHHYDLSDVLYDLFLSADRQYSCAYFPTGTETLEEAQHRDRIRALYDERFCRMWEFYLAASEIAFRNLDQMVFQIQLARRKDAVPLTRDYMHDWEQDCAALALRAQSAQGHA